MSESKLKATPASKSDAIYLIDASAFIFRAYHAMQPLSSKGRPSHAVAGFASTLMKLLRDKHPFACVAVFDSKKPSFRKEISKDYKANRPPPPPDLSEQIVAVMKLCEAAGLPILQEEGMEADDWIASFVETYRKKFPIVIVSTDKDLTQLIGDRVVLYDAFKDKIIAEAEVEEKWGVKPEQMGDLLSLTGDSSDNVPGLPGVGPKTAAAWLKEYGSIDKMLKQIEKLPEKIQSKFAPHLDSLSTSRKLIQLKNDLKIPFADLKHFEFPLPSSYRDFLNEWDLHRVLQQFDSEIDGNGAETRSTPAAATPAGDLKLCENLEDLRTQIKKAKSFVFDVETNSFDRMKAKLIGISFAINDKEAWYVPVRHETKSSREKEVIAFLQEIFADTKLIKIAHNLKYDYEILMREGIDVVGPFRDTMIEAHLLHADRRSFSLDNLSRDFLGKEKGDLKKLLDGSEDFSTIPLDQAVKYAAQDAHLTFELHQKFSEGLKEQEQARWLYEEVEIPLAQVLSKMESRGILVDADHLGALSKELHKKITKLQTKIYEIAGGEFNIASPKQLQEILFTKLGLTPGKKTKTGFSTDESVLQELADEHEMPKLILEVRGLSKLTSTYIDVLPTLISEVDGRLHTHYHQTGTATGRLSSSDPNLQNIPIRTEEGMRIREAFKAAKGYQLLSADYSQVELRLFAHMSGDENMIAAFKKGRDIHSETAKVIFGSDDKEFRSRAKAINFGIIYGISAFGLAKQLGISRTEASQFIDAYFEKFPRIKTHMEDLTKFAKKNAYTETLFGRRRPLPDIQSKNPTLRGFAERISINAPVQGTAADIMKAAMVRIERRLEGMKSRMLLQVHDELVFEVTDSESEKVLKIVTEEMMDLSETPIKKLEVPLVVDSGFGPNWAKVG